MKIAINTSALGNDQLDFSGFEKLGDVSYFGELNKNELKEFLHDFDAIVVNKVEVDRELISACPRLKYVGLFSTGYNLIDLTACRERGITVCNVPNYSTNAVAQHTFALLLQIYGATGNYSNSVRAGDWIKSKTFCYYDWDTREVFGKTFGVYGFGNIGKAVARIAEAFGMNVIVCGHKRLENCPYRQVTKEEIFRESDVLSLHCPMNDSTKELVNKDTLSLMKPTAVLINTARGGLVNEQALADALNEGRLYGAGLDTVAVEPMLENNPLRTVKNCVITPHIAWIPLETRARLLGIATENLAKFILGTPQNVVVK
jgi:glycerate dehydrogenase